MRLGRWGSLAGMVAILVVTPSCRASGGATSPTVCDGVSSEAGGCTVERHVYVGTTCDEVAAEWGTAMDRSVLGVINGPSSVDDQARSSRLRQVIGIVAIDLDQHLESLDPPVTCDPEEVLLMGERIFSDAVRIGAGRTMYDGDPVVTYDEWLEDVRSVLGVLEG